jgi:NADH:ubiquinone oxidoreductase subunit F (NADH-binding)
MVPRLLPSTHNPSLDAHFRRWGQMPGGGLGLIEEVERAGLRGRGGASFPTATKLRSVAASGRAIVVGNGTEGEPASHKDKSLLVAAPHLVLDGASIAAETVGAREAIICVDRAASAAGRSVTAALAERRRVDADRVAFRVEDSPSHYVTGEESALVHWLNGGVAKPTFVPPRPYERGVRGRPTLVNNVETLAHLALIARFGAEWFRGVGTAEDPGTALVTLTGDVSRPGVYEIPLGASLAEVWQAGGWNGVQPQAVLIGGYSGAWITGAVAVTATTGTSSLRRVGTGLGCGAISVIGPGTCGLMEVARITRWLAGQSAGQCGPCARGLPAIATAMDALAAGDRGRQWERQLHRWLDMVAGRGACHHPDGTVRFVRSALQAFAPEIDEHRRGGERRRRGALLPTPDLPEGWQ